jgi:hypothetical protein
VNRENGNEVLANVYRQLISKLEKSRGRPLRREILIEEDTFGHLRIGTQYVSISPDRATEGNPFQTAEYIYERCRQFDEERERDTRNAILAAKKDFETSLAVLQRELPPAKFQRYVEKCLGLS